MVQQGLGYLDVLCLWAFLANTFGKGDHLAFLQGFETRSDDVAKVNEQVRTAVTADETITLALVEPFNGPTYLVC
jgi:hypothetical protein